MDGYNFSGGMFQSLKEEVIVCIWISAGIAETIYHDLYYLWMEYHRKQTVNKAVSYSNIAVI